MIHYLYTDTCEELNDIINIILNILMHWININKLKLNIEKTKILPLENNKI